MLEVIYGGAGGEVDDGFGRSGSQSTEEFGDCWDVLRCWKNEVFHLQAERS